MLGWSRDDLSEASRVGHRTIVDFERGARQPYERTVRDLATALEAAGVEFLISEAGKGPGLRLNHRGE